VRSTLRLQHAPTTFILRQRRSLVAVIVSITILGNAQTPLQVATISGTITDATGAIVPRAVIRLAHPGAPSLQTTTDNNGYFEMSAKPGEYILETIASGFLTNKLPVYLSAAIPSTRHIDLQIGELCGPCISMESSKIEILDASLTATLPLTPIPPYKTSAPQKPSSR
jgi:hypothetical protein